MADNISIEVTQNVKECLVIFGEAVESMPDGDAKNEAAAALEYLKKTADGESQPLNGERCPAGVLVWPRLKK